MTFRIEENDKTLLGRKLRAVLARHPYAQVTDRGHGGQTGLYVAGILDSREFTFVGESALEVEHRARGAYPRARVVGRGVNRQGRYFIRGLK